MKVTELNCVPEQDETLIEVGVMLYVAGYIKVVDGTPHAWLFKADLIEGDFGEGDDSEEARDAEGVLRRKHGDQILWMTWNVNDTYEGGYQFAGLRDLVEVPLVKVTKEDHEDINSPYNNSGAPGWYDSYWDLETRSWVPNPDGPQTHFLHTVEIADEYWAIQLTDETKAWYAPAVDQ